MRFQYGKSDYAQLMPASFKHWKEIEAKSGKKLFTPAGIMNIRKDYVMRTRYQVVLGIRPGQISNMGIQWTAHLIVVAMTARTLTITSLLR